MREKNLSIPLYLYSFQFEKVAHLLLGDYSNIISYSEVFISYQVLKDIYKVICLTYKCLFKSPYSYIGFFIK